MNPQMSFSTEEIKDNFSTPKFPKNKSIYALEKEENTLDTLRQHIDKAYNDKETFKLHNDQEMVELLEDVSYNIMKRSIQNELGGIYV